MGGFDGLYKKMNRVWVVVSGLDSLGRGLDWVMGWALGLVKLGLCLFVLVSSKGLSERV